jgi:hypothetical protein
MVEMGWTLDAPVGKHGVVETIDSLIARFKRSGHSESSYADTMERVMTNQDKTLDGAHWGVVGDTSRNGNLCTLRLAEAASGIRRGRNPPLATFYLSAMCKIREVDVLPAERRYVLKQGRVQRVVLCQKAGRPFEIDRVPEVIAATIRFNPLALWRWFSKERSRISPRLLKQTA